MPKPKLPPFIQTILFEDNDYLIVNKPPTIATLADRKAPDNNMLLRAKKYHPTAQVTHRLDKETSGILVFAKHPDAYKHLVGEFAKQKVKKNYHAVTTGIHTFENRPINTPITIKANNKAIIDFKDGKKSLTYLTTLQHFSQHTLLLCQPVTGRTHQIRLHTAYQKAPIIADLTYGGTHCYLSEIKKNYKTNQNEEERPLIQRIALHAQKISFLSLHNKKITIEAPYPKDFNTLIRQLSKNTPA